VAVPPGTTAAAFIVNNDTGDGTDSFGAGAGSIGVFGQALDGVAALSGNSSAGDGADGFTTTGIGLFGTTDTGAAGVSGTAGGGTGDGVQGFSAGGNGLFGSTSAAAAADVAGALGTSTDCIGVLGQSTTNSGVRGETNTASPTAAGVYGVNPAGVGVWGDSTNIVGTAGKSTNGFGVYGESTNSTAVRGFSQNGIGVNGQSGNPASYAGYFTGNVFVNGAFTVFGGAKSAAVDHPDGSQRRLYCMESPESYFEDFGRGKTSGGHADVALDADFAAVVNGDDYHVYLTPKGDCKGLYVSGQTSRGFSIQENQGGNASVAFDYRVVARRKDRVGARMEKVNVGKGAGGPKGLADLPDTLVGKPSIAALAAPARKAPVRQRPVRAPKRQGPPGGPVRKPGT
jgi:hypothetical protein